MGCVSYCVWLYVSWKGDMRLVRFSSIEEADQAMHDGLVDEFYPRQSGFKLYVGCVDDTRPVSFSSTAEADQAMHDSCSMRSSSE